MNKAVENIKKREEGRENNTEGSNSLNYRETRGKTDVEKECAPGDSPLAATPAKVPQDERTERRG